VALKHKELRQVEKAFKDLNSTFAARPIFHQRGEMIRGHVFCSIRALMLKQALERKLKEAGDSLPGLRSNKTWSPFR
jgi:transposase